MTVKPVTDRQQYWLNHLKSAEANDGTLVDYAKAHQLKPKDLYQWKTRLIQRGALPDPAKPSGFVRVSSPVAHPRISLVMPNGVRLELHGDLSSGTVQALVRAASELA